MFADLDLAQLIDDLPDAVIVVDDTARICHASSAVLPILGYRPDELIGEPLAILIPEHVRSVHADHHAAFFAESIARPMGAGLELHARRKDGALLPVEIALVPVQVGEPMVVAFVRDVSMQRSLIERLVAKSELVTAISRGATLDATMQLACRHARHLLRADACWVALVDPETERMVVTAGVEDGQGTLIGASIQASESLVAPETGNDVIVIDLPAIRLPSIDTSTLGYGPLIAARIGQDVLRGAVIGARGEGSRSFTMQDRVVARQFADVIAVALDLADAQLQLEKAALIGEHERIARDLHDTVIQRLFAEGLRLEAIAQGAPAGVATKLQGVVANLDEVIGEIRDTIFQLQPRARPSRGVRQAVDDLVAEFATPAQLRSNVTVRGDVDDPAIGDLTDHMLTVLREALANTVRHAAAGRVEVVVEVDPSGLALTVVDDGVGPLAGERKGFGLVNLQARAIALGGTFSIKPGDGGGTIVQWRVPRDQS